jgi:hypothetical protein
VGSGAGPPMRAYADSVGSIDVADIAPEGVDIVDGGAPLARALSLSDVGIASPFQLDVNGDVELESAASGGAVAPAVSGDDVRAAPRTVTPQLIVPVAAAASGGGASARASASVGAGGTRGNNAGMSSGASDAPSASSVAGTTVSRAHAPVCVSVSLVSLCLWCLCVSVSLCLCVYVGRQHHAARCLALLSCRLDSSHLIAPDTD